MNVRQSLSGFQYLIAGLGIITKPGLRRFVIIPILINLLFFLGFFFTLRHFVSEFNHWFDSYLPAWLQWLNYLIWILFFATFVLVFIYAFVVLANLIAAPFNNLLAEKVEQYLTGTLPPQKSLMENVGDIPRVIGRQLAIMAYYIPRALVILILFFIPIINVFTAIIWFIFNAWFMTMQFIDFPTDNHKIPLQEVRQWLSARKWTALSLGACILVAMMIPGVNLVIMPAAVAAATKFWVEENK